MTDKLPHAWTLDVLPRRKAPPTEPEDDVEADDEAGDADDDDIDDDEADDDDGDTDIDADEDDESDDASDEPEEDDDPEEEAPKPRRRFRRSTPPSGMGRPSTGPARRPAPRATAPERAAVVAETEPETEVAPDISLWPGTSEAARQVGKHPSTIKLWRSQNRIRALQDASGCWRHHPDDLAEAIGTPDQTDPGAVLASGMTAIVQQGDRANDRLIAMTELSVDGLKETIILLRSELKRVYDRNELLEKHIEALRDKHAATHSDDLKHERFLKKLELKHELDVTGAQETSVRLNGLLAILGPIAASIGARLLGNLVQADTLERAVASGVTGETPSPQPAPGSPPPATPPPTESRLVPLETRITDAMGRLCAAVRALDNSAFAGLRAMLPSPVAEALDDIIKNENDSVVGKALATIVKAAQNLSDLQFKALRPIAPQTIAAILAELREILKNEGASVGAPP
jgi:hypothetical protein